MQLSDGEKLILIMLCDIHKALKIKDSIDPDFVSHTIHNDHLWGLRFPYSGIPFSKQADPPEVKEVEDAMEMWAFIEDAYDRLSPSDKEQLEKDADPFGKDPKFTGFDCNKETKHMSIARYFVEHLYRFSDWKGRDFNSHEPSLDRYNHMVRLFKPMRAGLRGDTPLNLQQLTELLKAYGETGSEQA
jgi:uncharacterized protein YfbU (UPF0304 family)